MSSAALQAIPLILVALAASAAASFLITPLVIRFAPRIQAMDQPDDDRRVHREPVPRTGGLAVAAAFLGVGAMGLLANELFHFAPPLRAVRGPQVLALFGGVAAGAALGYLDDRFQLRARWQLLGQLALAGIAVAAGILIDNMVNPLGDAPLRFEGAAAMAITTLWVVGMINSVNFVDGLDGLSTGIALIAAVTLGVISLVVDIQPAVAVFCALLAGSLLGFLPYNFHPARVFIGTAGVFAVGYALAILSVLGTAKVTVALLVLGVPIIDTFWIIIRRLAARRSPFSADRGHFHHRLLDLGLTHRGAVLLIYGLCAVLAVLSLVLASARDGARGQLTAFLIIVIGGGLVLFLMTRRTDEALNPTSYPDE